MNYFIRRRVYHNTSSLKLSCGKLCLTVKSEKNFTVQLSGGVKGLDVDTFREYFEQYSAERKTNMQDYTPQEVSVLLSKLTNMGYTDKAGFSAYDPTAGTGALLISKWWDDMVCETLFTYAPHRYFYMAEEYADNAVPYLIHNLAMRGMNAIVVHGDTLSREAKQVYFIQNVKDDALAFSDVNVMPRSEEVAQTFGIWKWVGEPIDHIESSVKGIQYKYANRSLKKAQVVTEVDPKLLEKIKAPWTHLTRVSDVAHVERAQKGKEYPKGATVIQMSATKGQIGLLKSSGEIPSHYAVIVPNEDYYGPYLFLMLQLVVKKWFARVQEGLNVKLEDIKSMPIYRW